MLKQKNIKEHIEYLLCIKIEQIRPISGGDISQAYLLETESERFFCKFNAEAEAYSMFLAEKEGLKAIAETGTISTPQVLLCEPLDQGGLLIMEYLEPKRPSPKEMAFFGHRLADLHSFAETNGFGWSQDNFIGSLPQPNKKHTDWFEFYCAERLTPQLKLAKDKNRLQSNEIPSEERLIRTCEKLLKEVSPSLLHGDLWNGNYLISTDSTPYLIDPATYYGHREVDIAMTRLFGGFGKEFYDAYTERFPKIAGDSERLEIYQLYYLLVHLNLFGASYKASVTNILEKYF